MLTSGCLGHHYDVSRSEAERLVRLDPVERARNIYAVQNTVFADDPEPAMPWEQPDEAPPMGYLITPRGYWVPSYYVHSYGVPYYQPPYRPRPPAPVAGGVHGASPVPDGLGSSAAPASSSSGSSSGGSVGDAIKGMDRLLALAIVVGVAVGITMAITEGFRYEGAVAVHPHHPVHLWHSEGRQSIVPLDELTLEDLRDTHEVTLSGEEGAGMWLSGAAPLNRKGFSYQFGMGNDSLALPLGQSQRGAGFRFAAGYFPTKTFGLLVDTRLQSDADEVRGFYNVRLGAEAQWMPLSLWRLHAGPFLGGGRAWSATSGRGLPTTQVARPYLAFGAIAELELATRLGLTFRWTQDWLPTSNPDTTAFIHSWSVGFSVY